VYKFVNIYLLVLWHFVVYRYSALNDSVFFRFETEKRIVSKLNCRDPVVICMATCHSLTIVEEKITGDPLDVKMFEATDWVSFLLSVCSC